LIASVVMAFVLCFVKDINFGATKLASLISLGVSAFTGVIVYAVTLVILRTGEINKFIKMRREKNDN